MTPLVPAPKPTQVKGSDYVKGQASALTLAKQGFHVFPLSPGSKVPPKDSKSFHGATADCVAIKLAGHWQPDYGVGIATGHDGLIVFDLDTDKKWQEAGRVGPTGIFQSQAGQRLKKLFGDKFAQLRWVSTPSGGAHFYGRVTGIPAGVTLKCGTDVLKTKAIDGVALDLRGNDGYVVAYDGGSSRIANEMLPVHKLLEFAWQELVDAGFYRKATTGIGLRETAPSHAVAKIEGCFGSLTSSVNQERVREALRVLIDGTPSDMRSGRDWWRDNILFPLATACRKSELDGTVAHELFIEASKAAGGDTTQNEVQWTATISTPLMGGERGLGSLFHAAKDAGWAKDGIGTASSTGAAQDSATAVSLAIPDTGSGKGRRKVTLASLVGALTNSGIGCLFNERRGRFEVCIPNELRWQGRADECTPLDDTTIRQLQLKFSKQGIEITEPMMHNALKGIGDQNRYDPVKDYFEKVRNAWDGVKRIDTWLIIFAGADDTPFVRGAGVHFLMGAIKRTFQPGAKHDEVLTLIGGQGAGKSTLGKVLATIGGDTYFSDADVISCDAREVIERTGGSLIHEFGEVKLTGKDGAKVKDLLSRTSDKARMAYGREETDRPRRFVFLATGNNPQFLTDGTGNRRWHVVEVCKQNNAKGQAEIDLIQLASDRDQLWAEAVAEYDRRRDNGQLGFDPGLYKAAADAAEAARVIEPWEELLPQIAYDTSNKWATLAGESSVIGTEGAFIPVLFIGSRDLLQKVTIVHSGWDSTANAMRLSKVAKAVGWVSSKRRVNGAPINGFLVPAKEAFDGGE